MYGGRHGQYGQQYRSRSGGGAPHHSAPHGGEHRRDDDDEDDEHRHRRRRSGRRSRTPSPVPGARGGAGAAAVLALLFLVAGMVLYFGAPQVFGLVRSARAHRRRVRSYDLLLDDGATEEEVDGPAWQRALGVLIRCAEGSACDAAPPTPPPTDPIPSVRMRGPPPVPDPRPRICCSTDYAAPCPAGWRIVGMPGYRVAKVPWRFRGACPRLAPRHVSDVNEHTQTVELRCEPPPDYVGPCGGQVAPPCDPVERRVWAEGCNVTWPCEQEVLLCEWHLCAPRCQYGEETVAPEGRTSCAVDHVKQPVSIVTPFPADAGGMTVERRLEILQTLRCNVAHPHVARVHLLLEPSEEELAVRGALQEVDGKPQRVKVLFRLWKEQGVLNQAGFDSWKAKVLGDDGASSIFSSTIGANLSTDDLLDRFVMQAPRQSGKCAPYIDPCGKIRVAAVTQRLVYSDALRFINERAGLQGRLALLLRPDVSAGAGFGDLSLLNLMVPNGTALALTPYEDLRCFAVDAAPDPGGAPWQGAEDGACDCRTSNGDCGARGYLFRVPVPAGLTQAALTPLPRPELRGQVVELDNGMLQWAGVHVDADLPFSGATGSDAVFLEAMRYHRLNVDNRCGALRLRRRRCAEPPATARGGDAAAALTLLRRPVGPFHPPPWYARLARWWYQHNASWPLHPWRHAPPRMEGARALPVESVPAGPWYASPRPRTAHQRG